MSSIPIPDWTQSSGDAWARRWRETDSALSEVGSALNRELLEAAPAEPFRAFEIGCGPGSTTLELARSRPDAAIVACDLSPALARLAKERLASVANVRVVIGDAQEIVVRDGPFDLLFSRHGVMFFNDPARAFRKLRAGAAAGATLVFSCFQDWTKNPWASELAPAAAGRPRPGPGREPGGFAFADPAYVQQMLEASGWSDAVSRPIQFDYVAASGTEPVERALAFLSEIGPASRALESLPDSERQSGLDRMRRVIERHCSGSTVTFPGAAWIWSAKAASG